MILLLYAVLFAAEPHDALDEVNAVRAQKGLKPYVLDRDLQAGARSCAAYRADRQIAGHTRNDFAYLAPGVKADAAGCAAWKPSSGWGACCTYDNYRFAGAAYAVGRDGRRYMHLFVRRK